MTRLASLFGAALGLLLLQALLRAFLPVSAVPDLLLVFALALGLRSVDTRGLLASFAIGLLIDVLSGSPLGLYGLLRGTACASTRLLDRALYLRASLPWALYVFGYCLVDGMAMQGILQLLAGDALVPWGDLARRLPVIALVTAAVSPLVLGLGRWLEIEPARETGGLSFGPGTRGARP